MIKKMIIKMRKSQLISSGIVNTIGSLMLRAINFITLPIFIRLLTPNEFGTLNNFIALSGVMTTIVGMGLNSTLGNAKYTLNNKKENEYGDYKSSILCLSLFICVSLFILSMIFKAYYKKYLAMNVFSIILLFLYSYSLFVIHFYITDLSLNFKNKTIVKLNSIIAITGTFLSIIFILLMKDKDYRYLGQIYGLLLPNALISIVIILKTLKRYRTYFNINLWKYGLCISVPLIPHILSGSILSQFDRILIFNIIGEYEAGIYSFIYNIGMILAIIWSSVNQVWVAWFYKEMKNGEYIKIRKVSNYYIYLFTVFSIFILYISPEIIKIIAPPNYWSGINIVLPIVLSGYIKFIYSLPVNVEFFLAKTKYISLATIVSAIVNIVLNLMLIPKYGYTVAAYTTLISYVLQFLFHYYIYTKIFCIKLFAFKNLMISILIMIMFSIIFINTIDVCYIRYIIFIITMILLYYLILRYKSSHGN